MIIEAYKYRAPTKWFELLSKDSLAKVISNSEDTYNRVSLLISFPWAQNNNYLQFGSTTYRIGCNYSIDWMVSSHNFSRELKLPVFPQTSFSNDTVQTCETYLDPAMALKTPWPICGTCRHIPPTLSRDTTAITHQLWPNFSDFQTSASKGCHSCTLLYEAVQEPFKSRLETGPIYLERAIIDGNIQVVAVTVDLAASPDHSAWDESLWKRNDQPPSFQYVPIADVKYVTDSKDIPHDARLFKGKHTTNLFRA
jgi:hypothetical protein